MPINFIVQIYILLLDYFPLHFHGRGEVASFNAPLLRGKFKFFHLFPLRNLGGVWGTCRVVSFIRPQFGQIER